MKNYGKTDTTAVCLSVCQSDISDSETGQIPETGIFASRAIVDQVLEGLCYQKETKNVWYT